MTPPAIEGYLADIRPGCPARPAISEFGDPALIARGFRAEIAARMSRRLAVNVLVSGPMVGLLWIITRSGPADSGWPCSPVSWPSPRTALPIPAAAVASIIRIALSHRAARRCLAIRPLLS